MRCDYSLTLPLTIALAAITGCSMHSVSPQASVPAPATPSTTTDRSPYPIGPQPRERAEFAPAAAAADMSEAPAPNQLSFRSLGLFGTMPGLEESAGLDPMENLRQASFATEGSDTDPVLSPDGDKFYFASTAHRPNPDIYVKAVEGRAVTQLTNDPAADVMPAVNPDGSRIAFASDRAGTWDIYVMNASGGQAVQITSDNTHELHPTWSPDGRWIAFCKLGEVSGRWEIWVCDAEQAGAQRFLTLGLFPDWHPTAGRIVYQRSRDRGDRLFSIWTLDYVKGEATNLTEIATNADTAFINPKWSPDGEYVAFAGVPATGDGIFGESPAAADVLIMKVRGGGLSNLTGGRFANLMPTWGPANSVYFTSDRAGVQNIWSVNADAAILAAAHQTTDSMMTRSTVPAPRHPSPPIMNPVTAPMPTVAAAQMKPTDQGATPAPAQTDHDLPPEIANVPIDDQ